MTIILLMKYLSFAGGDDAGEEQFTSSISPTLGVFVVITIHYDHDYREVHDDNNDHDSNHLLMMSTTL